MPGRLGIWVALAASVAAYPPVRADDPPSVPPPATVESPPAIPVVESPATDILNMKPTIRLRGRIEVDAVMPSQSAASQAQIGTLQGGYGFRRARIGTEGEIDHSTRWVGEVDFAGGEVRLRDMFVGLTALPFAREWRMGYFREPFSLEGMTSSRFTTFMERSTLNQFDAARNWGIAGYWYPHSERMTAALGAFRDETESSGMSPGNGPAWAITGRVSGLPVYEPDDDEFRLIHLGTALSFRQPQNDMVTFESGAQSNLISVDDSPVSALLPTLAIPAQNQQKYNLQAAVVHGPFSFQTEWFASAIQQPSAGVVFFHGMYAYVSWFPTGEHRGYNPKIGDFDRVSVRRPLTKSGGSDVSGCGALEIACRFSFTDFTSPNLPPQQPATAFGAVTGVRLYETTWGVNWYINDYTRVMANYTLAIPDSPGSPVYPVHIFGLRTAIFW